jgi:coenzyme F420 hydrogenase subunit beta
VKKIYKADVPKDEGLSMETDQGNLQLSQEETRDFIRNGCYSCIDPTSELADLSIGSTEADTSWCALIVRTEAGEALVEKASASGVLQLREPSEEAVDSLRNAALNKKRRVLAAEGSANGHSINTGYLKLPEEVRRRIMEMGHRV